jgi:hypothetical protein
MTKKDINNLEDIYESINNNNKEKELISEDANETIGGGLVYMVVFALPFIFEYFARKYPELKDKFNQINNDLKNNQQTKQDIQNVLKQSQQKKSTDGISSMLSGGVRKDTPRRL